MSVGGATIEEINYLASRWNEVVHIACLHDTKAPASARPYTNPNIRFLPLRPTGGSSVWGKAQVVFNAPSVIKTTTAELKGATNVQLRTPTGIGVFLLPAFTFLFRRDFGLWVKYAGNWASRNPPLGYRFQRWWLSRNLARCKVTINGSWPNQPEHCKTFENPCLTQEDIENGRRSATSKQFVQPFRLVFIGRLEDEKGVGTIIDALAEIDPDKLERIDLIGDGPKRDQYEKQSRSLTDKIAFHGFLGRDEVHKILSNAHFLLLPSESEGFPKVIAEAACYGCVPIVSDVGSIGQYVNDANGFLWDIGGLFSYSDVLDRAFSTAGSELTIKSQNVVRLAPKFTFDHYLKELERQVFSR